MSGGRSIPWLVLAATIVVGAVLQAVSAAPGLGRMPTWLFAVAAAGSVVALWLQLVATAWAAAAVTARAPLGRVRGGLWAWAAVAVAATGVVAVVFPLALPLIAIVMLCVLPGVAAGRSAVSGFAVFARTTWRAVLAVVVAVIAIVVSWVVALLAGFFLTGTLGAFAMWLWFGLVGSALLMWWGRLAARTGLTAPR
ncbi:hypothetical protein [Microbacterium rhizomatis]|uniref:Uncharacterized protein n=1 Tax=Microbacterium rhizomatis TaxID=1631477 RepID=A0A5J5IZX9_9MICO|nr:hypothetical protein [Microbacterium rhizomatis]KAA9107607.1 hypothetical protein F6B43_09075 [Microbacterium rhizomatis]